MSQTLTADIHACQSCRIGSCCYEGVELTNQELRRIVNSNPSVPKPWFRLLKDHEKPDGVHNFSTIVRGNSCVFQGPDNRCMIYEVRPQYCRDFPVEHGKTAPHYQRLCVLFHHQWPANSSTRRTYLQRENSLKKD